MKENTMYQPFRQALTQLPLQLIQPELWNQIPLEEINYLIVKTLCKSRLNCMHWTSFLKA